VGWDYIQSSYNATARSYEDRFLNELEHKPRDRELLADFATSVDDPIAEVGSGPGQVGLFLRQLGHCVIGADLSFRMAQLARNRLDAALVADMRFLPVGDNLVGGLVAFYSLIHVKRDEVPSVLREFDRVLRPGGHLLLAVHEGEGELHTDAFLEQPLPMTATLFSLDELVAAIEARGFSIALAERRSPYEGEHPTTRLYVEGSKP
jgi:SAM-dependent methyltransferase